MEGRFEVTSKADEKLARIRKDPHGAKDFLICDAKDGDMGGGVPGPGPRAGGEKGFKTRADYLAQIEAIVEQDVVDLMLMSISTLEILHRRGVFARSKVGTAIRANDATDIWGPRNSSYKGTGSLPFSTCHIPHAMYGRGDVEPGTPPTLSDLGLYSVTFLNDAAKDRDALERYRAFRLEAETWGFRHFLEVFNPNVGFDRASVEEVGDFVNDSIIHTLAGVPEIAQPQFLKMPFNGPRALGELVAYDPRLIVGILGGGAGTTRDTFELLAATRKYGGRLVLFGRKINLAEDPLGLIALMRRVVEGEIGCEEAVKAYHDGLRKTGTQSLRPLEKDLEITEEVLKGA